jgi:hypothetical protein
VTAKCKSCGAAVTWCVTSTGKKMPVDAKEAPGGNVVLEKHPLYREPFARVVAPGTGKHTSHFATCPNAIQHRKPRREESGS